MGFNLAFKGLMLRYLETCNDYNLCYWSHWSRTCDIRYGNYV